MNVLKISPLRCVLRQVNMVKTGLPVLCICLFTLIGAQKLAAEQERELAQDPVSLTDLANFNASEIDMPQPDKVPDVVDAGTSAQTEKGSQINVKPIDGKVSVGSEGARRHQLQLGGLAGVLFQKLGWHQLV